MENSYLNQTYQVSDAIIHKVNDKEEITIVRISDDNVYFQISGLASKLYLDFNDLNEPKTLQNFYDDSLKKYNPPVELFNKDFNQFFKKLIELEILIIAS